MINPKRHDPWYRRAVLYQLYPLSFADSNGDGFGDIAGIIDRLDYLNDGTPESLGVGAVWLSPLYRSPMADWGYDVADHCDIDPRFGALADFDRLVTELHRRDMKVLLDYVPNHTSDQHAWFQESRASLVNLRRDWYIWADPKADGSAPNNWLSQFGGSAWTLDHTTGQYYLHSFLPQQPDLNWRNPRVHEAMLDVLRFWLARGVDGFRTDAVSGLIKDAALRDDPPNPNYHPGEDDPAEANLRVYSAAQPELNGLLGSFCEVLAEKSDTFLVSEVYLNIAGLHQLYQACEAHPLHAPFNFNLMKLPWGAKEFSSFIDEYEASLGPDDWPNYVLGNHDRPRLVSRLGVRRARLMALLQLTLRGLPVIYNGEELGLKNAVINTTKMRDPIEKRVPGYGLGRDPERTPMPWSPGTNGGFTTGQPWLPIGSDYHHNNVETEEHDPESFLSLYRYLIHLRSASPALMEGDYRTLASSNADVFIFAREVGQQRFFTVLNFSDQPQEAELGAIGQWVAGTHRVEGDGEVHDGGMLSLEAYEGRLYEIRRGEK